MKAILFSLLFFLSSNILFAQAPGIRWQRTFGAANTDYVKQIVQTTDGGYAVAGFQFDGLDYDYYIIKIDQFGVMQWQKKYGGSNDDIARTIQQTSDKGFIIAGDSQSIDGDITNNHGTDDCWVVKLDSSGNLDWQQSLGGSDVDGAQSIQQTRDGGYILTGFVGSNDGDVSGFHGGFSDVWVVKLKPNGDIDWQKCLGGTSYEEGNSIKQTSNGGYIVAGYTLSNDGDVSGEHGNEDYWVVKLDSTGQIEWQKCLGGSFSDEAESVIQDADGDFTIAGSSASHDGDVKGNHKQSAFDNDFWIVKLDSVGSIVWGKCFGGGGDDQAKEIQYTMDGGYIVGGHTISNDGDVIGNHGYWDYWIVKINSSGGQQWQKCLGGSNNDMTESIIQSQDGNYVTAGYSASNDGEITKHYGGWDFWIVKLGDVSTIDAIIFLDKNSDGIRNNNEIPYTDGSTHFKHSNYSFTQMNGTGEYKIDADTGFSVLSYIPQSDYYINGSGDQTVHFSTYNKTDTIYFAIQPIPGKKDLQLSIFSPDEARLGADIVYKVPYKNVGTTDNEKGTIQLIKDRRLDFRSSIPRYNSISGDTINWSYENFNAGDTGTININFTVGVPPIVNTGDTLFSCVHMDADGDLTPRDNRDTIYQVVYGPTDPNDKRENHAGAISKSDVVNGDYLTYTIRFQNTGNDTAFNIIVRDTLDNNLDWSSLEIVDASSNYQLNITNNNECEWYFSNIALPDSNVNEAASHGYIVYRIKPLNNLKAGNKIKNSASIYFDYNLPVKTNTEKTTIIEDIVLPLHLLSFTAQHNGASNLLQWSTTEEFNTDRFEIQRSKNAKDFTTIGNVHALNNGKISNAYTFTDAQPLKQINYYRLKIFDKDGKYIYSPVRSINNTTSFDVTLFPNPVKDILTLNFNAEKNQDLQIDIVNAEGKKVYTQKLQLTVGAYTQKINIASLHAGIYFIQCTTADGATGLKFVKQ